MWIRRGAPRRLSAERCRIPSRACSKAPGARTRPSWIRALPPWREMITWLRPRITAPLAKGWYAKRRPLEITPTDRYPRVLALCTYSRKCGLRVGSPETKTTSPRKTLASRIRWTSAVVMEPTRDARPRRSSSMQKRQLLLQLEPMSTCSRSRSSKVVIGSSSRTVSSPTKDRDPVGEVKDGGGPPCPGPPAPRSSGGPRGAPRGAGPRGPGAAAAHGRRAPPPSAARCGSPWSTRGSTRP